MTGAEISDERKREIVALYWKLYGRGGETYAVTQIQSDFGLSPGETQDLVAEIQPTPPWDTPDGDAA
jgi:hypothetical protein